MLKTLLGNLRNDDGDGYENVTKKWICAASNFITLIPSRLIRQMMANFCWSSILKDSIKVPEEKKKVVVFCSRPRQNVKLGSFTLRSCNDGREMCKKRWRTCKVVCFADLNLSVIFCRSRCCRRLRFVNSLITRVRWCLRRKLPLPLRNIKFYFSHNLKQNDVKRKLVLIINFQRASHICQHNLDRCQPLSTNKSISYTALISDRPAIHFGIPRRTCIHEV